MQNWKDAPVYRSGSLAYALNQANTAMPARPASLLPVAGLQWLLLSITLFLGCCPYVFPGVYAIAEIVVTLLIVNLVLLVSTFLEMVQSQAVGKFLLAASVCIYFWFEAFALAVRNPPFAAIGLPVSGGQFDTGELQLGVLYVACFELALFVGYSLRPPLSGLKAWAVSRVDTSRRVLKGLQYPMAAGGFLVMLVSFGFHVGAVQGALLASRTSTPLDMEWSDPGLLGNLACMGVAASSLILVQGISDRSPWRWLRLGAGAVAALPFLMGGTRHQLIFVLAPLLLVLVRQQSRRPMQTLLRWVGGGLVAVLLLQVEFAVRDKGWNHITEVTADDLIDPTTTGQFSAMLFAEYVVPGDHPYFHEFAEPYFITHWVPRAIWPNKPYMESWAYFNAAWTKGYAYNVTPSVIGQFHLNFGMFGVIFIGLWLGFLAFLGDHISLAISATDQKAMLVIVGLWFGFIVSSFRFYSPIYLTYFVFGAIGLLLLTEKRHRVSSAYLSARISERFVWGSKLP
ncbi:MAG TPA: O-antigen polymerase [Terracidiphilus sp.]|nr:O-antigen polymerase [Terracidiphilus sp.]